MSAASKAVGERRAIVTGASSGIGAAICAAMLDAGYEVISLARHPAAVESPRLRSVIVDLTDPEATAAACQRLARDAPTATIVHNAGTIREKPLADVPRQDLIDLANLHVTTAMSLVQANLAHMRARKFGRIVLVSSRAILGLANRTAYSATKAAMVGLTRTWALELARDGIVVNAVAPGPIADTIMFDELVPAGSEKIAALSRNIPVQRLGRPADVARAVMFLAAEENSFVTGQTLYVCGGTSVGSLHF
ncbi:MAG: SDR family oxidoreductase [Steroidobacteraceae bacterium]